ncbi:sigma-54-dependent transcriptional regulator [Thermodesulfobacteriota bacterium]
MKKDSKILVADDDRVTRKKLRFILEKNGFDVLTSSDGNDAKSMVDRHRVDLIISDYKMPNMNGLELLKVLREEDRDIPFVLITAYGSIDSTLEAIKLGAVEYLTKPFENEDVILAVHKALNLGEVNRELSRLQQEVQRKYSVENLIGHSPAMQEAYKSIHNASENESNVLITGETGTGKEVAARAIHYNGRYKKGPFIAVNCSAFSKGTLESELFGHVKGAFTDAHRDHVGRFEMADQGTLFLDEVGDIPLDTQIKLLRVLQEKQFEPVGGQQTIQSNFRLIAATNKDLMDLVKSGLFREDLFYRLSVINIAMPPLRAHSDDIPLLIEHFLKQYTQINIKEVQTLSIEAMKIMQRYSWPGNVRQLENAVESAVAMCEGNMIRVHDLPLELKALGSEETFDSNEIQGTLDEVVERVEKRMIRNALEQNEWIKARAARVLGTSERVLSYKMKKYGIVK